MQIAQVIGGYTLGRRRPAAPRDGQEEARGDGAAARHLRRGRADERRRRSKRANELFDLMEKFAGYGFNKSHAAAYALVAYQTAYFKAHHAAAFMAANLSAVMDDTDKVQRSSPTTIELTGSRCCRRTSTRSDYRFVPVDAKTIRYGLGGIKGTGESAIEAIVRARGRRRAVPRPVRLLPARRQAHRQPPRDRGAGARGGLRRARRPPRGAARLRGHRPRARRAGRPRGAAGEPLRRAGRRGPSTRRPRPARAGPISERLAHEKAALGFYLTGHPFRAYEKELRQFARTRARPAPAAAPSRCCSPASSTACARR